LPISRRGSPETDGAPEASLSPDLNGADRRAPRRRAPTTPQGEATYERLLDAALKVFLAHGYVGARVGEITRAAGVAYGTFYHHFHTKSEVIRALADRVHREIFGEATRMTQLERPLANRAFNDILFGYKAFTRRRDALRVLDDAVGADPSIAAEVFRLQQRDVDDLARIISNATDYYPIGNPQIVSLLINSLGDEVARRWIRSEKCTGDPELDEPALIEIARLNLIMNLAVLSPESLGLDRTRLQELMERMCPDGDD
jgi:AcrR family transcriptional regulator